ncbi:MAG: helix-turn-helix transcriptional regulator [Bacilli bacterium]|nr:helix-turn-helix transcriptional regulator [Bacilli bacterium]
MDPKKTGIIISDARKKLKMTQKDLADKLYVSDKAVSKWERGLCFPDISVLIPLTEILNISLYDLLRGEKVNKKEVEETIKNTINYSNSEIKRKKKKYITICSIIISIIVLVSIVSLIFISKNNDIGAIVDRDTIHTINYYSDYKTTIDNTNGEKLELIVMKLPLRWKERQFIVDDSTIKINYGVSYKDVVKAYNDENYVKEAMINNASVIFTMVSDVDSIEIRYTDYRYSISKEKLQKAYDISDFDEVIENDNWVKLVSKKLINDEFVNDTFKLFNKSKVSKDELKKEPVSDR